LSAFITKKPLKRNEVVAASANAYWPNFANPGVPNGEGLAQWPVYETKSDALMEFALKRSDSNG